MTIMDALLFTFNTESGAKVRFIFHRQIVIYGEHLYFQVLLFSFYLAFMFLQTDKV